MQAILERRTGRNDLRLIGLTDLLINKRASDLKRVYRRSR
jgi:hypothetical protein